MLPEPNVVLGDRYLLIGRIAVGGMGEVWEATDQLLNRGVAVKILKDELRTASTFLARFRAEARNAGRLSHHGIATVYDYGETSDVAFLVMELVRGRPLSDLMAAEEPSLPTSTKLSILSQAAEGLHAAHIAGVVHRDVKPGNLMIRDDGTVKVTDFGIARALSSASLTEHGQMIGTPAYVSPEQATGGQVTAASDIYSLGVVAYELFAGHPPFDRDTPLALALANVNDSPPPLPDTVPPRIAGLIRSALAKDPSGRPPSAANFAAQLRGELVMQSTVPVQHDLAATQVIDRPTSSGTAGRTPTLLVPMAERGETRRPSNLMLAAFAGLVVLMGAAIWAATRPDSIDDARPAVAAATTISASTVATATSLSAEPIASQPVPTEPVLTLPLATQPVVTQPASTAPLVTEPSPTQPLPTQPLPTQPRPTPPPPAPVAPAATAAPSAEPTSATEAESFAFVADYYDRLAAGEYETTWELLSPGFRDDRNLTFEKYVAYWENTTLELSNLRFFAGPGPDESRVRFDARYDLGSRVIDETDEITLVRQPDGQLIITEQRTV